MTERLGLPANLVAAYENGEKPLDFVQTRTFCLAIDVPFAEFVLWVERDMESTLTHDEPIVGHEPDELRPKARNDADGLFEESDDLEGGAH